MINRLHYDKWPTQEQLCVCVCARAEAHSEVLNRVYIVLCHSPMGFAPSSLLLSHKALCVSQKQRA